MKDANNFGSCESMKYLDENVSLSCRKEGKADTGCEAKGISIVVFYPWPCPNSEIGPTERPPVPAPVGHPNDSDWLGRFLVVLGTGGVSPAFRCAIGTQPYDAYP